MLVYHFQVVDQETKTPTVAQKSGLGKNVIAYQGDDDRATGMALRLPAGWSDRVYVWFCIAGAEAEQSWRQSSGHLQVSVLLNHP